MALASAIVLAGCSTTPASPESSATTPAGDPVSGGVLDYRAAGGGRSIDPAAAVGYGLAVPLRTLVDSLVFNDIDGSFRPWLAEKWEINADATEYTFHLRDDVTFSDGEKLDADAVKGSFEALERGGAKYATANLWIGDLAGIDVVDATTVTFRFASPNSSFLQAVSTTVLGIVAPATAALSFDERQDGLAIIGSGPFVAAEVRGDEGYRLERRDDYAWSPEGSDGQDAAYLDAIDVHNISDNSIAASELVAGNLDLIHNVEPADKTAFASSPVVTIRRDPLPGAALGFNANVEYGPLQDERVRTALSLAVDRDAVLERASAIDIPATSVFARSNPYWEDKSSEIVTDQKRAAQLLDDAGWSEKGGDGIRVKDGERLSFDLIYSASTISHEPNLAVVQAQWAKLGIELKFGSLTTPELNQRLQNGDYAFSWGSGTRPDVDVLRGQYAGKDAELDDLFTQILAQPDVEGRKELANEAVDIILDKAYFIPLYDFIQPLSYRNEVNLPTYEATHIPWLADAWIDDEG
ncbi:ABC transporter substrate-binding protein [Microbacterium ulmi]|uniref:ABC transporter substrate-binding protein n=1 Tax=Microbacterium ulmi TaxID=179095 RepID=UPI001478874C